MKCYSRLRDLREDRDWTQTKLGELLHCSQRCYSYYERGEVDIPTHVLDELASIYDTSVDYLLGLTDVKTPYKRKRSE